MNQVIQRVVSLAGSSWLLLTGVARAEVKLPAVFSDHMVLQRDQAVPIWGEATPGEKVTVKFRNQEKSNIADAKGHWTIKLDPLTAGGPDKLVVSAGKTIEIDDVLVGEVWVGSGQSNMAMGTWTFTNNDVALMAMWNGAPYPQVRQIAAGLNNGHWEVATTLNQFSALLVSFGLRLNKELNVPVGLMLNAVSGSASSCWLSQHALDTDPTCQAVIKKSGSNGIGKDGGVGRFYEQSIRPIIPYGIRGVLWDQGESGTALDGVDQYTLMGALIRGWREDWGQDLSFIYIQKPSGGGCAWEPTKFSAPFAPLPATATPDDNGALQIYEKIRIMTYPNTGMAISSDLGSGTHPPDKSAYGQRAATVALGMVYGKKIEYSGPIYDSHKIEGNKVRVSFKHIGQGLVYRHGNNLQGFVIAGDDKVWHWADAIIDGDTVVLSNPKVSRPVAVRYAWAAYRPWANLFNKDGLPAVPFCTDL